MLTPFEVWRFYQIIEKAALASMYAPQAREGYPRQVNAAQPPMTTVRYTNPDGVGIAPSPDPTGSIKEQSA